MTRDEVIFGPSPDVLVVRFAHRDTIWGASLIFEAYDDQTRTSTVAAWPEAPVLVLGDGETAVTFTADLDTDPESSVLNALATWTLTPDQYTALVDFTLAAVTLEGVTVLEGSTEWLS